MAKSIIQRLWTNPDLNFIPAYISAILSGYYALMNHPEVASQVLTFATSLLAHCTRSRTTPPPTLKLRRIPNWAMIPVCLVLGTSMLSITLNLQVDGLYAIMSFVAIFGTLGAGWAFKLPGDLVFGLLPFVTVTALLVVRLGQNLRGMRLHKIDEQEKLREKAQA